MMLQQTQVKTMLPYYHRWLERFPDFKTLAAASSEDVLKNWEGLGYYSRARNFHKLAQAYIALDEPPETQETWQALPGIGPYTSAAISSISQNFPAAVIDGNVVRILARLTNDNRDFKNNGDAVKGLTPLAQEVLDRKNPGTHNQAMMELGATVCTKHNPLCTVCPVVEFCEGAAVGSPEALPKIQRKATVRIEIDRYWILHKNKLLLHRIPDTAKQLAGQYELPATTQLPKQIKPSQKLTTKQRSITNRRITETIYTIHPKDAKTSLAEIASLLWVDLSALDQITLSGPHRRWITELLKS
jgi:A/G-specific adenine glycosylase